MNQKSNYKILNLIGRGQFGKVFAAVEYKTGKLLALKELNQKYLSTSNFLRELHFLVSLEHKNIASCQGLEHYHNHRYLVMNYYEGGTLRDLINSPFQLTLNQSLKLIIDILHGLSYAHAKGIIHRDIKPENILLKLENRNWTAHISDFGIAKLHQELNPKINMGDTGSPAYMSPEQFYGQYSYSCDLYAVGIILYELVVGERPFSGMPKELISAHINQSVEIPNHVPFMVRIAISKSLQKLPHRRFEDALAMAKALELAKDVLPTEYIISSPPEELSQPLNLLSTTLLSKPVDSLATASQLVYLGQENSLTLNHCANSDLSNITEQWEIPVDNSIQQIEITSQGCFIITQSSIYYLPFDTTTEKFRFFAKTFLPIISFPTNSLVCSIEPTQNWFSVSYLPYKSKTPIWEIYQLPNCQLKRSQINRKLWHHLITLNSRYGLGIYINKQQYTEFHLFNNRGIWLANFTVQINLKTAIYNPQFPKQLLAIEINNPNAVIVISLKEFSMQRIQLKTKPNLIIPCDRGYLVSDRHNRLTIINGDDLSIEQFQIPLSEKMQINAIALTNNQLLIATTNSSQSQLHQMLLRTKN